MKINNCPCCSNSRSFSDKALLNSKILGIIERISEIEHDRSKEFEYVGKVLDEIRSRIFGNTIGFVQETVILAELKTSCPYDRFSDELSSKHGTDIVAYVRDGVSEIGKISISVKRHKKWNSGFIEQLEDNLQDDGTKWGILVTTVFPTEALNENIWTTFDSVGRLIILVKPPFSGIAYYAVRQIVIYEHRLNNALLKNLSTQSSGNLNLVSLENNSQIVSNFRSEK